MRVLHALENSTQRWKSAIAVAIAIAIVIAIAIDIDIDIAIAIAIAIAITIDIDIDVDIAIAIVVVIVTTPPAPEAYSSSPPPPPADEAKGRLLVEATVNVSRRRLEYVRWAMGGAGYGEVSGASKEGTEVGWQHIRLSFSCFNAATGFSTQARTILHEPRNEVSLGSH